MDKLHSGARWLFRVNSYVALFFGVMFLSFVGAGFVSSMIIKEGVYTGVGMFLIPFLIAIVLVFVFGEIYSRLAYNNWRYKFTDNGLKLERGIIWKKYSDIPYERVQNVDIHRGILARMLGFSTIDIQTAGFSGGAGRYGTHKSEGYIPAVGIEHAEKIREYLMHKISGRHGKGVQ